ncbi:MAG: Fe(2+)-trafficking protein [Myxococcota bacterium]
MNKTSKKPASLSSSPFPGPLGLEIASKTDQETWQQWQEMQIQIINENRLDLSEAKDRQVLLQHLRAFLHLDEAKPDPSSR